MRKAFSVAILGATFMALASVPAQALEIGPVQVIVQPRVVVAPEAPRRVVVIEKERHRHHRPVVEKRIVVVDRHGHHVVRREVVRVVDRDHHRDRDRWRHSYPGYERGHEEVVIVRR